MENIEFLAGPYRMYRSNGISLSDKAYSNIKYFQHKCKTSKTCLKAFMYI